MRCFSDGPLANTEWILLPRPMLAWGKEGGRGSLISPANIRDAYRIFNFALFRFTLKKFKTPLRDKQDFFLTWGKEGGHCSLISPANIQDAYSFVNFTPFQDHAEKLILKKIGDVLLTWGIEGVFQLFSILTHCEFILKKRRFFLRKIDVFWLVWAIERGHA